MQKMSSRLLNNYPYRSKLLNLEYFADETAKHSLFNSSEDLKCEENIKAVINEKQLQSSPYFIIS